MSVANKPLPRAKADELVWSGRAKGNIPGLANLQMDSMYQLYFSTNMTWHSTATRTSKIGPLPFNFKIADIFTVLKTAPVSTGAKKFKLGTTTSAALFFVTGNFKFVSGDSTTVDGGMVRRGSATNFVNATGSVGQIVQFTLPPTAATVSNAGSVYGVLVLVPR